MINAQFVFHFDFDCFNRYKMTKAKILGMIGNGVGWPELPLAIQSNDILWISCRT